MQPSSKTATVAHLFVASSLCFVLLCGHISAVPLVPNANNEPSIGLDLASEWGTNKYIEYRPGNGPVVLTAPHGGDLTPASIPDRTYGTTVTDSWTREMTFRLQEVMGERATKSVPHVIVCHLKRTKLDANRDIVEGAQGNPEAELAWNEYHAFINRARQEVLRAFGKGLYIDMHGQAHEENWNEFGYLLTANDLNTLSDRDLQSPDVINRTSIRNLGNTSSRSFGELIRGSSSIGGILERAGYKSVPSPTYPSPGAGGYFSGGYNTQVHGSLNGGTIDGIQLEMSAYVRRTSAEIREQFTQTFAGVIFQYLATHYNL